MCVGVGGGGGGVVWLGGGSSGNCAVFVANRIIIGAGADSWVVIGPCEERWSLASSQGHPLSRRHADTLKTHLKKAKCHSGGLLLLCF